MQNVVSLSGGKDSTAMLLMMLDKGEAVHSVVFFDTGWEFPEMLDHIGTVEDKTGLPVVRLSPPTPFDHLFGAHPVKRRSGPEKGSVHRIGYGWPSVFRRWCTRIKIDTIRAYLKTIEGSVSCIGFASDEKHRIPVKKGPAARYPLIEWGISEEDALRYCYSKGFAWGGLYEEFGRVSCFCCPLQSIGELRKLRTLRPKLWEKMLSMDAGLGPDRGFRDHVTVHALERRFGNEERQLSLFK